MPIVEVKMILEGYFKVTWMTRASCHPSDFELTFQGHKMPIT